MFKSYLTIAVRNLVKRQRYFFLNILGLITGMTGCLFIFHYVSYEKSYDTFQPLSNQLVRLRLGIFQNGKQQLQSAAVYPAIAPFLQKDFPEVENFCRLHSLNITLSNDAKDIRFNETKGFYADPSFLKMFDVRWVKKTSNPLSEPFQMVLSQSMAEKYFGKEDAAGKKLTVKSASIPQTYLVTGVFEEYPANSHLSFDYLVSYNTYDRVLQQYGYPAGFTENSWEFRDFYAYLQLNETADWKKLESKLPAFCNLYINNREENKSNYYHNELYLTPIKDIHLYSDYFFEAGGNGNGNAVFFLFLVALFIICIAWINYINLATARSVERAKEVGVRKVMGAIRTSLIKQFLLEGLFLNLIALLVSLFLFSFFVNDFDFFTGRNGPARPVLSFTYQKLFVVLFFTGTFLSGIYPAFVISAFNPIAVLKGVFKNSSQGIALRQTLITVQFFISIALIAATIIVYQQMNYMRTQQLGADLNQTLVLQGASSVNDTAYQNIYQSFKDELLNRTDIKSVAASTSVPGKEIVWTRNVQRLDIGNSSAAPIKHIGIDQDFIGGYGIKIIAGRNFSKQFASDNKTVLLNEKAVKLLGFKNAEEAVNKKIKRSADTVTVVGVTADFHQQGLQKQIEPLIFLLMPGTRNFYSLKTQSTDIHKTVSSIETQWKKYFPEEPLNYFFADEAFNQQYKQDILFGKVFRLFAVLAILISCTGLLGLSSYNVLQRAKEVSIRKVMGAGIAGIVLLLTRDFVKLIVIAFVVAAPVCWYVMDKWLENFAYRIAVRWWVFALAGLLAVLIAVATIIYQVMKAAVDNPVKNLRIE